MCLFKLLMGITNRNRNGAKWVKRFQLNFCWKQKSEQMEWKRKKSAFVSWRYSHWNRKTIFSPLAVRCLNIDPSYWWCSLLFRKIDLSSQLFKLFFCYFKCLKARWQFRHYDGIMYTMITTKLHHAHDLYNFQGVKMNMNMKWIALLENGPMRRSLVQCSMFIQTLCFLFIWFQCGKTLIIVEILSSFLLFCTFIILLNVSDSRLGPTSIVGW